MYPKTHSLQFIGVFTDYVIIINIEFQNISVIPKRNCISISNHSSYSPAPSPWKPLIYFLFLWTCLLSLFQVNGIIQQVVFVSGSLRFIRVVACVSTSFPFIATKVSTVWTYHILIYPFIGWWTFELFVCYKQCCYEHACMCYCINMWFQFSCMHS